MLLDELYIYIPTVGRINKQIAINSIPSKWLKKTRMVAIEPEYEQLRELYGDIVVKYPVPMAPGLAKTRQWIVENCPSRYLLMIDDDASFHVRHRGLKLKRCSEKDICDLFDTVLEYLRLGFPAVGVSARQDNWLVEEDYNDIGKMYGVLAYDIKILQDNNFKFRVKIMEDFDVTLQLLKEGFPNRIIYKYAWSQPTSGASGGCSIYRNDESQRENVLELCKLHPKIVTMVEKVSKKPWEGFSSCTRIDVNIKWQKAYQLGTRHTKGILQFVTKRPPKPQED